MKHLMETWAFFQALGVTPRHLWSMLGGTFLGWGVTQRTKFLIPATWSSKAREVTAQAIAFVTAFAGTLFLWGHPPQDGFIAALIVGLWTPAMWTLGMLAVGWWKPSARIALSQDVRLYKDGP